MTLHGNNRKTSRFIDPDSAELYNQTGMHSSSVDWTSRIHPPFSIVEHPRRTAGNAPEREQRPWQFWRTKTRCRSTLLARLRNEIMGRKQFGISFLRFADYSWMRFVFPEHPDTRRIAVLLSKRPAELAGNRELVCSLLSTECGPSLRLVLSVRADSHKSR